MISIETADRSEEAAAVASLIEQLTADSTVTVGVIGRIGTRSQQLKVAVHGRGIDFEDWALPTHVPSIVALLRTHATAATYEGSDGAEALARLGDRCRGEVDPSDAETLNELAAALDALREMLDRGASLEEAIASCRPAAATGEPVCPGVHVLTGHKGKGQEFDWVVIVGLEEGQVPTWQSKTDDEIAEELRVLHVMASRARYGLAFTYARHDGRFPATPSRWLELLRAKATEHDHA